MKKIIITIIILITLTLTAYAQTTQSTNITNVTREINFSIKDPTPKLDENLEKYINVYNKSNTLALLLGIKKDEKISMSQLIIIITLIVWALFELQNASKLIRPLKNKPGIRWSLMILITLLIGATGAAKTMAGYLIGFTIFGSIQWATGDMILTIIILLLIALGISKIIKKTKEKAEIEEAKNEGESAGSTLALLRGMEPYLKDLNPKKRK